MKLVFDDETVLKTQPYLLADFGLYSGMELSEEDYRALLAAAGKASARTRAVRTSRRPVCPNGSCRSGWQKGEEAADAKEAVGWLKELHLLDDGETARQLVASAAAKGYGKSRIKNILYEKGSPGILGRRARRPPGDGRCHRPFSGPPLAGKDPDDKEVKTDCGRAHSPRSQLEGYPGGSALPRDLELEENTEDYIP